jgi:hypothetical protein
MSFENGIGLEVLGSRANSHALSESNGVIPPVEPRYNYSHD